MIAKVFDDTATSGLKGSLMQLVPSAMSGAAGLDRFRTANSDLVNRTLYNVLKILEDIKLHVYTRKCTTLARQNKNKLHLRVKVPRT